MKIRQQLSLLALSLAFTLPAAAQNTATQTLTLTVTPGVLSITGGGGTSAFSPVAVTSLTTGQNALTLTNPPTFTINDTRGTSAGWNVALATTTTVSPAGTTAVDQHLFYNVGAGAPLLANTANFQGSVEGVAGSFGNGNATGVTAGSQDTNSAPVKTVSAGSGFSGNGGSRTYRIGTAWALQDVNGGGSVPAAGAYSWTLTATVSGTP